VTTRAHGVRRISTERAPQLRREICWIRSINWGSSIRVRRTGHTRDKGDVPHWWTRCNGLGTKSSLFYSATIMYWIPTSLGSRPYSPPSSYRWSRGFNLRFPKPNHLQLIVFSIFSSWAWAEISRRQSARKTFGPMHWKIDISLPPLLYVSLFKFYLSLRHRMRRCDTLRKTRKGAGRFGLDRMGRNYVGPFRLASISWTNWGTVLRSEFSAVRLFDLSGKNRCKLWRIADLPKVCVGQFL